MAVKARETLESKQVSLPVMGVFLLGIVAYTFAYNRLINQLDDLQLKTIIGVISLLLMIGIFIVSLRYTVTTFEMTLTHDRLVIERKLLFMKKKMVEVNLGQAVELLAEGQAKKIKGNQRNFTLLNVDNKKKYVLYYQEGGKSHAIKIQCSAKFYELLKKQVEIASF